MAMIVGVSRSSIWVSWVAQRMYCAVVVVSMSGALGERPVRAGGFGIPEIGVRRTAMGSIVGRPDDASAIYHNPAGLVLAHGWALYASFGLSLLDTEFQLASWGDSDRFLGAPGS